MRVCILAVLAAAVCLAPLAAADGLQSSQWPRRAMLQAPNSSRHQGFDIKHLMVFAGLMVALAFGIVLIGCLCVRYRHWLPSDGIVRHPPGMFRRRQPEVIMQDAKPRQLPIIVVMPDNCISYAHKLLPEEAEAAEAAAAMGSPSGSIDGASGAGSRSGSGRSHTDAAIELQLSRSASEAAAALATRDAMLQAAAVQAAAAADNSAADPGVQPAPHAVVLSSEAQQEQQVVHAASEAVVPPQTEVVAEEQQQRRHLGRRTYASGWVGQNWSAAAPDGTPSARVLPIPPQEPEIRIVPAFIECDGDTVHYVPEPDAASIASAAGGSSADVSAHGGSANGAATPQLRTASASLVERLLRRSSRQSRAAAPTEGQQDGGSAHSSGHRRHASRDSMNSGYFNRVLFEQ